MKIASAFTAAAVAIVAAGLSSPVIATANAVDALISADYESSQWALTAVRASDAWGLATGEGVVVAVIDTGADAQHPDLDEQLVDGSYSYLVRDEDSGVAVAVTEPVSAADSTDYFGHGTHVSGIIAAERNGAGITGLAYDSKIMPVQLNLDDVYSTEDFAEILDDSIRYAVLNGADVINMSLGTSAMDNWEWETDLDLISLNEAYYAAEEKICGAITFAAESGVIVVSASGNSYTEGNPLSIPAYCEDGISVGAVNPNISLPAYFSSQDSTLDVVAPGESVFSTVPTEIMGSRTEFADFPYMEMSGTSMASPMVAAAAALWLENYTGSDPFADFRNDLQASAKDLMSIVGFDPYTGFGLLDAYKLLSVEAPAHNFSSVPYLRIVGMGPSYNESNGVTVVWDAPLASQLPISYTLEIFQDGDVDPILTEEVAGTAVRASMEAIQTNQDSYLVLTANYELSSNSTPPMRYASGGGGSSSGDIDPVTGLTGRQSGDSLQLRWDEYTDSDADAIMVLVNAPGAWAETMVYAIDGQIPSEVRVDLYGSDPANSDLFVEVIAVDTDSFTFSEFNSLFFYAKALAAVSYHEMYAPNAMAVNVVPNALAGCTMTELEEGNFVSSCAGMKLMYNVKIHYQARSGKVTTRAAPQALGYVSYWGNAELDAIYVPPRKGSTPIFIELTPLNLNGKAIPAAHKVLLPLHSPVV